MNQSGQQVNHEVACDASPIGPISSPAHKTDRVEGDFRGIPEPGIPIQIIRRQARWRHPTLPGAVGSVPAGTSIVRTSPIAPDAMSSLALIDVQLSAAPLPISTMRLFFSPAAIIAKPSETWWVIGFSE